MSDYIKREDALKFAENAEMLTLVNTHTAEVDGAFTADDIEAYLKSIPAADVVERKVGEWTDRRTIEHDGEFYCSVCGFELDTFMQGVFYNYCPNCGADMRNPTYTLSTENGTFSFRNTKGGDT